MTAVPLPGFRIGHVQYRHPGLPEIALPYAPVQLPDEISLLRPFVKQGAVLGKIGIDPHADLQSHPMQPPDHPLRIREGAGIPGEVGPGQAAHPVAVEMEHGQGDAPLRHAADEAGDGLFVIIRGKAG